MSPLLPEATAAAHPAAAALFFSLLGPQSWRTRGGKQADEAEEGDPWKRSQ